MKIITHTKRLYLREFTENDAIHFFEINSDPDVIKYTGDGPFDNLEAAVNFLKNYEDYNKNNMGRWAVCLKNTDEFLGWCGLKYHPEDNMIEVGYRFYKKHWNKGYATEAAKASIDYGFKELKLKEIYAHAHIKNYNSQKVIEKCQMHYIKQFDYDGIPANLYKIENPYLSIKNILSKDTYVVRHPILREGRPIEDCVFDHDDDSDTFHLGLYILDELLGVITYIKKDYPGFKGIQYQLRGMAVLKDYQKRGFGNLLMKKGEEILKQRKANLVWCNAREKAANFYKRNGFTKIGKPFVIPKIGLHFTMYKSI